VTFAPTRDFLFIILSLYALTATCQSGEIRCSASPPATFYDYKITHQAYSRNEIIVPVVFHIIWSDTEENISDELLLSQIQVLNDDFNRNNVDLINVPSAFQKYVGNPSISFCLATMAPDGRPAQGIIRHQTDIDKIGGQFEFESGRKLLKHNDLGGSSAWETDRYLNIWVSGRQDGILGFATFPDETILDGEDGIEIDYRAIGLQENATYNFNLGRTLTHEIGHYLNLDHLWGKTISCNGDGDMVDDTPKQGEAYFGCPTEPQYSCDSRDMISNFMNFTNDRCLNFFTRGQSSRMLDALFRYRYRLISSGICSDDNPLPEDPLKISIIRQTRLGLQINLGFMPSVDYQLYLYDITGQLIWSEKQNSLSIHLINNSTALSSGVYVVSMIYEGNRFARKVFISG
jgi:hypothetical protein